MAKKKTQEKKYEIKFVMLEQDVEVLKDALHLYDRLERVKSNKKIANNLLDMIDFQQSRQGEEK